MVDVYLNPSWLLNHSVFSVGNQFPWKTFSEMKKKKNSLKWGQSISEQLVGS